MSDYLHKALKWISYNRYLIAGFLVALGLGLWGGCSPVTTTSIVDPERPAITADELEREVVELSKGFEIRRQEIDQEIQELATEEAAAGDLLEVAIGELERKAAERAKFFEIIGGLASSLAAGSITPTAAVGSAVTLAALFGGGGALIDNRRKDRLIRTLKNSNGATT